MSVTRLGFVGVGKHAQKMAAAFRECGAEIVAFDRGIPAQPKGTGVEAIDGFGLRRPWRDMVTAPDIEAIVVAAPPDVTRQVAEGLLGSGKPACLTKPFGCGFVSEPWVIDFWRLYSPAWLALKADLQGREIRSVHVDFYGNGPTRTTHSGLLDYGPHALAFALDLGLKPELTWRPAFVGPGFPRNLWTGTGPGVSVCTGNGGRSPMMRVQVETDIGSLVWNETDGGIHSYFVSTDFVAIITNHRQLALRNFCRAFLAGEPSDTLRISCEAMRILQAAESEPAKLAATW